MVPEGANEKGWALISRVFHAVVYSFVAGDKGKCRMMEERTRQGITYAEVTANSQASQNANQQMPLRKEMVVNVSNSQLTVPEFMDAKVGGTHGGFLNIA